MSLDINVERVCEVLLADGWHEVEKGTFFIDSYEFNDGAPAHNPEGAEKFMLLLGGVEKLLPARGFEFEERAYAGEKHGRVAGPITSVLAVKYAVKKG